MSQLVSPFLSSLGNTLPIQLDTTPSTCPYIVNWGKDGEYICGVMSQSGTLCAKHKKCKPQVYYRDKEAEGKEEEESHDAFMSRACEATPEADTPTRPSTERKNNRRRRTRESIPVTDTPTHPRTPRNKSSPTSATDTPTSAEPSSTPRRSTQKFTPKATPKSASTRKSRSSLPGADSTPHTLTGISRDGIEVVTGQLNDLIVVSSDGIEELVAGIKDLNVEDEDGIAVMPPVWEWPEIPKPDNIAESVVSYGPRDSYRRGLKKYLMKGVDDTLIKDLIERLPVYPRSDDGEGYVYIFQAIPVRSLQRTTDKYEKQPSMTASGGDVNSKEMMIVKVGTSTNPDQRLGNLPGKCGQYLYKHLEVFPEKSTVRFRYKAEQMAHLQLQHWRHRPKDGCLCGTEHKELFEVTSKQLKAVFRCVNHWATVVNTDHEKLWPSA